MSKAFLLPAKLGLMAVKHVPGCTVERDGHRIVSYETAYHVVTAAYKFIGHRINTYGAGQIKPGAGWVVAKHSSGMDIPDISKELRRVTGKKPYFVARDTLVKSPWDYAQYDELGAKFIDKERPSAGSMRSIIDTVRDGNLMVVFPEGTRVKGRVGEFNPGAAMMAYMLFQKYGLDAPIYCMGVRRGGNMVDMRIAPPMRVKDFGGAVEKRSEKKRRIREMTAEMQERVRKLSGFGREEAGAPLERIVIRQSWLASAALEDSSVRGFFGI